MWDLLYDRIDFAIVVLMRKDALLDDLDLNVPPFFVLSQLLVGHLMRKLIICTSFRQEVLNRPAWSA